MLKLSEIGAQGALFDEGSDPSQRPEAARSAIKCWSAEGVQLVTLLDADYPGRLLTIHQRPPFLF